MRVLVLAVFLAAICNSDSERCVRNVQEIGAVKADQKKPVNYDHAILLCEKLPDFWFLQRFDKLTQEERALCGDQLVPYVITDESSDGNFKLHAVNLKTGKKTTVKRSFKFACVLCQHYPIYFEDGWTYSSDGFTRSSRFVVHLTRINVKGKDNFTERLKNQLSEELTDRLRPMASGAIKFHKKWTDKSKRLHIEFRVRQPISTSVALGGEEVTVLNGTFLMRVEDVNFCPEGDTVGVDGVVTHWPRTELGEYNRDFVELSVDASTRAITGRQCGFNNKVFHGDWDQTLSRWELSWKTCSADEQYLNEWRYMKFLNASDINSRHTEALKPYTDGPVDTKTFDEVANLVDRQLRVNSEMYAPVMRDLVTIMAKLTIDSEYFAAAKPRASLVVADLKGRGAAEGFSVACSQLDFEDIDEITINGEPTLEAQFAFRVSYGLLENHTRVAFVIARKSPSGMGFSYPAIADHQYVEVTVMFPRPGEVAPLAYLSNFNHHVDIKFNSSLVFLDPEIDLKTQVGCYGWSFDVADWSSEGCEMLNIDYDGFGACRCSGKYVAMQHGVPFGRYALKK